MNADNLFARHRWMMSICLLVLCGMLVAAELPRPPSTDVVDFVVVSDCHMTRRNVSTFADLTCAAILADPDGPGSFLVANGDMDPFVRVHDAAKEKIIAPLRGRGIAYRFHPVIGNHDLYNTSTETAFNVDTDEGSQTRLIIDYNRQLLKDVTANPGPVFASRLPGYGVDGSSCTTYSFDSGPCHIVVLDLYVANDKPGRGNGNFAAAAATWLEADLSRNKLPHCVIFGHEPLIPDVTPSRTNGDPPSYRGGAELLAILKRHQVAAYFSGHTHQYRVATQDGTTHINSGLSGIVSGNTWIRVHGDAKGISFKAHVHQPGKSPPWIMHDGVIRGDRLNRP